MQTNALSRHKMQVALLAEPKTPLESSVFILLALRSRVRNYCSFRTSNEMCGGFFVHTMKHCYATALYMKAIRYTCAYTFTARVRSIRKESPLHVKKRARVLQPHARIRNIGLCRRTRVYTKWLGGSAVG